MIRPAHNPSKAVAGRFTDGMIEVAVANETDLVTVTPESQAMFEVNEVHKKVSAGQPYGLNRFSADQGARGNYEVN